MLIRVRATPGARREKIVRLDVASFEIEVREEAARNEANTRIREILAQQLRVTAKKIRLVSGHRSRSKVFEL